MIWRDAIDQMLRLIVEAKAGFFSDTEIVDALYNGMTMSLIHAPQEALEDFNIRKQDFTYGQSETYRLADDVLRVLTVLTDGKFTVLYDINAFKQRKTMFPKDISKPYYAKLGSEIYIFPPNKDLLVSAMKKIDVLGIKKPDKWLGVDWDLKEMQIPFALEEPMRQIALYYITLKSEKGSGAEMRYFQNFVSLIGGVYQIYGRTPLKIGITPGEER